MDCPGEETLLRFREGTLGPGELAAIEGHLDACGVCRALTAWICRADEASAGGAPPAADRALAATRLDRGAKVGRYTVLEVVGAGGMGVVFAAYDPELDRKIALKLLRLDRASDAAGESLKARLLREAHAMARLAHPNVISIYDVGMVGDRVFIAMEYVDGATLTRRLRDGERSWREVLALFLQAARGLAAAHDSGIVHRDFKPDNALVGKDGRLRVTDFGLARLDDESGHGPAQPDAAAAAALATSLTGSGMVGSPAYMAPEQMSGKRVDGRADQFSFCVALHEGLYGTRPFAGDNLKALNRAIAAGEFTEPPKGTEVPPWLRRALLRGLAAAPGDRYPTMAALIEALEDDPSARRRRAAFAALAVAAVAVAAFAVQRAVASKTPVCAGAERNLAGVWDDAARARMRLAFAGKNGGAAALASVEKAFDGYAAAWTSSHTQACEATRIRGEQSEEMLDLKMLCLHDRLRDFGALASVLADADAAMIARAPQVAQGLPPVAACNDGRELKERVPLPADPAQRAKIEELRGSLAKVRALVNLARYADARAIAGPLLASARALGYRPLIAQIQVPTGQLLERAGDSAGAEATLRDAALEAEAVRDDETAATAWLALEYLTGTRRQLDAADLYGRLTFAAVERLSGNPGLEAGAHYTRAVVLQHEGREDEAIEHYAKAAAVSEKAFGPDSAQIARIWNALGIALVHQNKLDEALDKEQRSVAAFEKSLGADTAMIDAPLAEIALILSRQGKFEESLAYDRRALALFEKTLGPDHPEVLGALGRIANTLDSLHRPKEALVYWERTAALVERRPDAAKESTPAALSCEYARELIDLGRAGEAIAPAERAAALAEKSNDGFGLAACRLQLARALWAGGKEQRARSLAAAARDGFGQLGAKGDEGKRQATALLAARGPPR